MRLYETHLPVRDTSAAQDFYTRVVGLRFAHRDPTRDIVFLWAGENRESMLGLWGPTTTYGKLIREGHVAFAVTLPELLSRAEMLRTSGVRCKNFQGDETTEPSVIGWMPSAQIYFRDPDRHLLEFIALLDDTPDAAFIGSLSDWRTK